MISTHVDRITSQLRQRSWLVAGLVAALLATGCESNLSPTIVLGDNVLLWHSWEENDALVLDLVLAQITEISSETEVISVYVPATEMRQRFVTATQQGVGPDLLLGTTDWISEFAASGTVQAISPAQIETAEFIQGSIGAVSLAGVIYGFPMSVSPDALYYNRTQVDIPPRTLDELTEDTDTGQQLAFVSRFQPAYWGIGTQGDGLYDAPGRFTLAESGFEAWLAWLEKAQRSPGIILNSDEAALAKMFSDQRVAYYISGPQQLSRFGDALGMENIGVAPLPADVYGASQPLLHTEAVMLGTASSTQQADTALAVAGFLTNVQQSTTFMRELGRIPANQRVEVDPRVYPRLAGFAQQARTAVSLPNDLHTEAFYALGDRAYANVLGGVLTPAAAVCEFGFDVVELQGYTPTEVDLPASCESVK